MSGVSASTWLVPGLAVPAAIGLGVGLYFAVDRFAVPIRSSSAIVTDKRHTPPGETYRSVIVGDQTFVQTAGTGPTYAVVYERDGESVLGLHPKSEYEALSIGQRVELDTRLTRLTRRTVVVAVNP